jgi:hypothetical protein
VPPAVSAGSSELGAIGEFTGGKSGKWIPFYGAAKVNPLRWSRELQIAWLALSLAGGLAGLFIAVAIASPQSAMVMGIYLPDLLHHPELYWPYPAFGFSIAALVFYSIHLLTRSEPR